MTNLELAALISERLSHSLRTPLGIVKTVLGDIAAGYELSAEDISDALLGVENIEGILESVAEMRMSISYEAEAGKLSEFLSSLPLIEQDGVILKLEHSSKERVVYGSLLERALEAVVAYLQGLSEDDNAEPVSLTLSAGLAGTEHLGISVQSKTAPGIEKDAEGAWEDIIVYDHRPQSLKLLFAAEAFHAMGAETRVRYDDKKRLMFEVSLPQ